MSSCAGMETSAPLIDGIVSKPLFHSSSDINQTLPQIIHILHFYLLNLLLNYATEFVFNCTKDVAIWQSHNWRDKSTEVGFTQFWHMTSLETFQTTTRVYDMYYRGLEKTHLSRHPT